MKRLTSLAVFGVVILFFSGCDQQTPLEPQDSETTELDAHRLGYWRFDNSVKVMTRNIYVGADVDAVISALMSTDPADDLPALADAIATFIRTDFPTRARALAREIDRTRPHIVGLQEVSEVDIVIPPGIPGLPEDGVVIDVDFLPILEAALEAKGLDYEVAASVKNLTAVPVLPIPGAVVSLADYDVILVDKHRVAVNSMFSKTFDVNVGVVADGVELVRGWTMVGAEIHGKPYTVVSTHLESRHQDPLLTDIRYAQATEIVLTLDAMEVANPTIVMGDLNDYPGTPMYQALQGAGFSDLWDALRRWGKGYTCCHAGDLSNRFATFDRRIDYVWARGFGEPHGFIFRTGWLSNERVAVRVDRSHGYRIWPSDHAGLVASVRTGWGWHVARHQDDDIGVGSE